jgi:hypothetical protein
MTRPSGSASPRLVTRRAFLGLGVRLRRAGDDERARCIPDGPAAARYPARDNLDAIREYAGDPIGNPVGLQ